MIPIRESRLLRDATLVGLLLVAAAVPATSAAPLATRVEQAAVVAARERVVAPDRLEVVSARFAGADPVDAAAARLELLSVDGPNAAGMLRVVFRMVVGGVPKGEARATVRGRVLGPAVTATRTLRHGIVVESSDLAVVETDLTRLSEPPLRDPLEATGLVPLRTLGRDRIVTSALLAPAPVVQRGQAVELRFERERVSISVPGRALRSGAPGEVVPAENAATEFRVDGIVQPDGSLLVSGRAATRRR